MLRSMKFVGGVAIVMTLAVTTAFAEETKGTIKTVNTERSEIVIKGLVKDSIYELGKEAAVSLDGVKAKLSDLREGDKASIIFDKNGERMVATEIRGLRKAQETIGNVKGIFEDKNEITLKGLVKDSTYELNKDATIWINGKKGTLKEIRPDDQVMVTWEQKGDHMMVSEVRTVRTK